MTDTIWKKFQLFCSIFIDLLVSVITLLFFLLNVNKVISSSNRSKSRQQHKADIARIATALRHALQQNPLVQVTLSRKPGGEHSARAPWYKSGKYQIDISALTSILEINEKEKYADVEALVTFEELCRATLKHGLLPLVVPGLKLITIGGAIQGFGADSTSWMYGTFDKSVIEATLITGDGNIISSSEAPDLWKALPGSNGTLALVVAARIHLIEATEWIRLRYVYYSYPSLFVQAVKGTTITKTGLGWLGFNQVMDAIHFCDTNEATNGTVAMYGGCVIRPESDAPVYKQTPFSPFFYQHVKTILTDKTRDRHEVHIIHEEYMPILDYLFRHDRGGAWTVEMTYFLVPYFRSILEMPVFRGLLHYFLRAATLKKISNLMFNEKMCEMSIIQDLMMPLDHTQDIIDWAVGKGIRIIMIFPILQTYSGGLFSVNHSDTGMIMNIGIYGIASDLPESNLGLQRLTAKLNGKVVLYSYVYADRDEFWTWYDHKTYSYLRHQWGGNVFMDLWDKVACPTISK